MRICGCSKLKWHSIEKRWRNLFFDSKAPGLVISCGYGRVMPPPSAVLPASSKREARGSPIP